MKRILLILVIGLTGCLEPNVGMPNNKHLDDTLILDGKDTLVSRVIPVSFSAIPLEIVVIDSCEYLYGPWGNGTVLCHKGNCKNHIYK